MSKLLALFIFAVVLSSPRCLKAQDQPTVGMLYNTSEMHSMVYRCDNSGSGQLGCEFTQTSVRPKARLMDLANTIDDARKSFSSEKPPSSDECSAVRQVLLVIEGKQTAPKPEVIAAMNEISRKDAAAAAGALVAYCTSHTEESFLKMIQINAEKDRRTCQVSSNSFHQTFTSTVGAQNPPTWVAQSNPEGECGIVQLSRFEAEVMQTDKGSFTFWRYIARKAITNPSGEAFPGAKCSGLDERSYIYDWRAKEHQLTCDYIEFSPL